MASAEREHVSVQSYFEARTNIRELEQRQFSAIQFFLGAFAAVVGGSVGLMQYVDKSDQPLLVVSLVFLSNVLSVSLFFVWCSLTMMINRVALFCLDITDQCFSNQRDIMWETWIRGDRNKASVPYLIESTLFVFLLPLLAAGAVAIYFGRGFSSSSTLINLSITFFGVAMLLGQYRWVLKKVLSTWPHESIGSGAEK